jgi:hypothetical protein
VGTVAQVGISVAEITGYLELTMLYVLQLCEIRGIPVDDLARRQLLLMTILLGDSGAAFMTKASGRAGGFWGRRIVRGIPMATINRLNRILGPRFITKWGTQQGVLVLGRSLPFGIGAAIGAGGNYAISRGVVAAAKSALGPAPLTWQ